MESTEPVAEKSYAICRHCDAQLASSDRFCGNCGKEVLSMENQSDSFEHLKPALVYYFATLLLLAVYKFTEVFPVGFEGLVYVAIIDIVITLPFLVYYRTQLMQVLFANRLKPLVISGVLIGALIGAVIVYYLATFINESLFDVFYAPSVFSETASPVFWTIVFGCVMPAIFEELAFRGFLFDSMAGITTGEGAMYITSFVFGVIHLSYISMIWLVPLGLAFGWLRLRYGTLWYGIIGHFAYNFLVSVPELL